VRLNIYWDQEVNFACVATWFALSPVRYVKRSSLSYISLINSNLTSVQCHSYTDTPSLLSNGYQGLFPWGWSSGRVKLTTHLHLVPRSRLRVNVPPLPQYVFMVWYLIKHRENLTFFKFDIYNLNVNVLLSSVITNSQCPMLNGATVASTWKSPKVEGI